MTLIDEEQAYQTLSEYYHHTRTLQHMALREALDRVPAVDAVPVIRCKDCFYRNEKGYCNLIVGIEMEMDDDDYCSRAERKDNG